MTWLTHFTGGVVLATWLLAAFVPASDVGAVALAAGFGALVPDLDTPFSHLARFSIRSGRGPSTRPFEGAATLLSGAFGHRGALHSLTGLAVASLLAGMPLSLSVCPAAGWAFVLGYLSHLLLDAATRHGVPLLMPWRRHRFHLLPGPLRFSTGSSAEDVVFALLAALTLLRLFPILMDVRTLSAGGA